MLIKFSGCGDENGVEEYYLYNPDNWQLDGWHRDGENLTRIWQMDGWVSPRLGIRFETGEGELVIYHPNGEKFLSSVELQQRFQEQRQRAEQAELLLEQERLRAEQEHLRAERLAEYLRSLGVDPDSLPSN